MDHLYFAYGSNLDAARMAERCPDAAERRPGRLRDHRLVFDKVAVEADGTAYANVEPAAGETVEGALYALSTRDLHRLDKVEGHPGHYSRRIIKVEEADATPTAAWVYFAVPDRRRHDLVARPDYLEHVLAGSDLLSHAYRQRLQALLETARAAWDAERLQ